MHHNSLTQLTYYTLEVPKPKVLFDDSTETFSIFSKNGDKIYFKALLKIALTDDSTDAKIYHWVSSKYSDFQGLSDSVDLHLPVELLQKISDTVDLKNTFVKFSSDSDIPIICDENKKSTLIFLSKKQWEKVLFSIPNQAHSNI